jgi:hypothetical protein
MSAGAPYETVPGCDRADLGAGGCGDVHAEVERSATVGDSRIAEEPAYGVLALKRLDRPGIRRKHHTTLRVYGFPSRRNFDDEESRDVRGGPESGGGSATPV